MSRYTFKRAINGTAIALALGTFCHPGVSHAQTSYYNGQAQVTDAVTVDLSVLDELGKQATLPDLLRGAQQEQNKVEAPPKPAPLRPAPQAVPQSSLSGTFAGTPASAKKTVKTEPAKAALPQTSQAAQKPATPPEPVKITKAEPAPEKKADAVAATQPTVAEPPPAPVKGTEPEPAQKQSAEKVAPPEPAKKEKPKAEVAKAEPVKAEPAKSAPAKPEPAKADVKADTTDKTQAKIAEAPPEPVKATEPETSQKAADKTEPASLKKPDAEPEKAASDAAAKIEPPPQNAERVQESTPPTVVAKAEEMPKEDAKAAEPAGEAQPMASIDPNVVMENPDGVTILFEAGSNDLPGGSEGALQRLAEQMKRDPNLRVQLKGYAQGTEKTSNQARRESLFRALAVRTYLMKQGIRSTRMDVRALGNLSEGGNPDRVDVVIPNG